MSYILDALNRSDKEKNFQQGPDINQYSMGHIKTRNTSIRVLLLIVVLVTANLIWLGVWMTERNITGSKVTENNRAGNAAEQTFAARILPESVSHGSSSPQQIIVPLEARSLLIPLQSLPLHIQKIVEMLEISSHIYSDHPDLRAVNINGERFIEMEMVTSELQLQQVTTDGIILGYEEQRFEVQLLGD